MTQHILLGRTEDEILWFRRRSFLRAAAAWTAMGGFSAAWAQQRTNVVERSGDILLNGEKLVPGAYIQTGDRIETGPRSHIVFVMGNAAFGARENTRMTVERGATLDAVSVLRMITGAVISVWSRGNTRTIQTPTLTAGIRGTGVYTEIFTNQADRTYFCNCYGTIDIDAGGDQVVSQAEYHQSFWAEPEPRNGRLLTPAKAINHTDEELEAMAGLIGQKTAWQILGRKGVKDGQGYMQQEPPSMHPAAPR
ncbi:MAG TPA: iron dicitrate transport regulator FecR [Ramlibacter sp.]|uniref:iron dicitrate transport regulator FecR n=1 Tax=Ramlibacter sp. TaxID=1917967 RepID=UPI002BEA4DBF|nr:iron dicitrate transport regulator FecR [Ramlibacter sp.]HVZ45872.1 iron dicitrate transport regulator FecR [Ramlibacter sp.]